MAQKTHTLPDVEQLVKLFHEALGKGDNAVAAAAENAVLATADAEAAIAKAAVLAMLSGGAIVPTGT